MPKTNFGECRNRGLTADCLGVYYPAERAVEVAMGVPFENTDTRGIVRCAVAHAHAGEFLIEHVENAIGFPAVFIIGCFPLSNVFEGEIHSRPIVAIRVLRKRFGKNHGDAIDTVVIVENDDSVSCIG